MIPRLLTPIRWLWRLAVAGLMLRLGGKKAQEPQRDLPADAGAELKVAALLVAAGVAGGGFVAIYALDSGNTQLLGAALALALGLLGAALIVASTSIVPQEQLDERRPRFAVPAEDDPDEAEVAETALAMRRGVDGISRRRLLKAAGGVAGIGLGAAALTPLASLGPRVGGLLNESPWHDGTRLVEENGLPVSVADLEVGSFLTAFAEGADRSELASSVVVVRVPPGELELPAGRSAWAPEGLLAFSKICTHAQCAVSLYRYPLFAGRSPGPALVCPCHYSTFDVLRGGERIFGPAVRPLPQLPLKIEAGHLVAAGDFSGPVGASWGGVREDS